MSPAMILSCPAAFEEYNRLEDERIARLHAARAAAEAALDARDGANEEVVKQRQGW